MMPDTMKALCLVVSDKKMFSCYSYIRLTKTCESCGGATFSLRDII